MQKCQGLGWSCHIILGVRAVISKGTKLLMGRCPGGIMTHHGCGMGSASSWTRVTGSDGPDHLIAPALLPNVNRAFLRRDLGHNH